MDLPFAAAVLLLGASLSSSLFGGPSRDLPAPCVCHCDCISEHQSSSGFSWVFCIIGVLLLVIFALGILLYQARDSGSSADSAKGKGKKGIFGAQQALSLQ